MTEICIVPARSHGSDRFDRLRADLAAANASGQDLGSRVAHIQAGGESLHELCRTADGLIDDLDPSLARPGR